MVEIDPQFICSRKEIVRMENAYEDTERIDATCWENSQIGETNELILTSSLKVEIEKG